MKFFVGLQRGFSEENLPGNILIWHRITEAMLVAKALVCDKIVCGVAVAEKMQIYVAAFLVSFEV